MIKAVIFDIGGVLLEDPKDAEKFWKWKPESIEIRKQFGENKISIEEFISKGSNLLGMSKEEFLDKYKEEYLGTKPMKEMYDFYLGLQIEKYILSDTNPIYMDYVKENYNELIDSAKKAYFSIDTGLRKDSDEVFKKVLKEINLEPEEVVFIDNKE